MLLLQNENITQYLTQDHTVVITVFGADEKRNTEMVADLTACTGSYKNIHCCASNSDEVKEAHLLGLSYGKYRAFLELQALDPDITVDDIRGLTMRQIRDRISALSNDTNNMAPDSGTGKNGGCGFGQGKH